MVLIFRGMDNWLERDDAQATSLGYPPGGPRSRQPDLAARRQREVFAYLLDSPSRRHPTARFLAATQLVLDATLLRAWSRRDAHAALAGRRGVRANFGYKLHAIVDRASHLRMLVLVT